MQYTIEQSDNIDEMMTNASIILYGDSGIGKTTLSRSMPNPLFLMMTGGGEHEPMPLVGRGIPFIRIGDKAMLDAVMLDLKAKTFTLPAQGLTPQAEGLFKKLRLDGKRDDEILSALTAMGLDAAKIKLPKPYKVETLVFDQLTTMYNLFMKDVLDNVKRNRENPETPNQQDYGQIRNRMHKIFFEVNGVEGYKKVYLCLPERDTDPETKIPGKGLPMLAGKLANEILQFVDFVFYFHQHREQNPRTKQVREYRRIATQPHGIWQAKDSSGKLPPFFEVTSPDFPLWDFMQKEIYKP